MGQVLYRKYRSKSLADVIGQDHITKTLERAISRGLVSHAYLFTGPRGVGKTSIARILAYLLNGIDYDESKNYTDIIEIDAASNRRIDEIRELRDKINIVPTQLKYKVYIIDEVHMLTREAFNALLKTLEEPPEHAIFILATTELHKVPETIVSRCQRYSFKQIDNETAVKRLKQIAKSEVIKIDDESLELIAEYSSGSFRDALSLLDQLGTLADRVTADETRNVLGVAPLEVVKNLVSLMDSGDMINIINTYRDVIGQGNDPIVLGSQIGGFIRRNLNKSKKPREDLDLLKTLLSLPISRYPEAELEITLLSRVNSSTPGIVTPEPPHAKNVEKLVAKKVKPITPKIESETTKIDKAIQSQGNQETGTTKVIEESDWQEILQRVKAKRNTLYGILRMAKAKIDAGELALHFAFPFHVKRANAPENKGFLELIIREMGLSVGKIEMFHNKDINSGLPESEAENTPVNNVPQDVLNVFNGAEVLEN